MLYEVITEGESRNLWHYTAPRYWPAWLLIGWLKLVALLPLRWSIRLHRGIGWAMTRLAPGRRRKLARSLALCFPEYSPEECERLAQRNLENMAIFVAEIGAVITSYSIHYTKLYDPRPRMPHWGTVLAAWHDWRPFHLPRRKLKRDSYNFV